MMPKEQLKSSNAPAAGGSYSQGVTAGGFLFLSGQGPYDPSGELVDESFDAQVRQVFANLAAVTAEAGKTLADAVRIGVYLHDLSTFDEMDAIYAELIPEPRPARTTIETPLPGFGVEIDAVIYLGD